MYTNKRSETHQSILVLRNEDNSMQETEDLVQRCVLLPFTEQRKLATTRIERKVGGPGAQLRKYIRVCSLRNRCLTSPQLAASLNRTRKTPVSMSTLKRRLRDAGLLGRVAKKSHNSDWLIKTKD
jgi:hypothetical protein